MFGFWGKIISARILLFFVAGAVSQPSDLSSTEALARAKEHVAALHPEKAEPLLISILMKYSLPTEAEEALVILTDIDVNRGRIQKALSLVDHFYIHYPKSRYKPRMDYYLGIILLKQNNYFQSALTFAAVLNASPSEKIFNNSARYLFEIVKAQGLREVELCKVTERLIQNGEVKSSLLIALGNIQIQDKRYQAALNTFSQWEKLFPDYPQQDQVKETIDDLQKRSLENRSVLLMLPITGLYGEVGKSLSQGILLRLEPFVQGEERPLRYLILDTYGDPIISIHRLRNALRGESVAGVIGPAMSDVSVAVAAELSHYPEIPMITPTATTHGISLLGKNIFQFNITTYALGHLISRYAMECENLKEFAILAPNTAYGLELSKTFESVVMSKGGSIIAKQFYDPEDKDFSGYFKVIRTRKVTSDYKRKWRGLGNISREMPRKQFLSTVSDSMIKLDGIFIPASNGEEAHKLSSQTHYHKLKTQVLGSSGWHDDELLKKGFSTARGTLFSTDNLQVKKSEAWSDFHKKYKAKWGEEPDKIAALGYDAVGYFIEGFQKSPETPLEGLRATPSFTGVNGVVKMNTEEGFNISTSLYSVGRKEFKPVAFCDTAR